MKGTGKRWSAVLIAAVVFLASTTLAAQNPDELYNRGRFAEAGKIYGESDMDNPRDLRYRYNRGCADYQRGDFKGALAAFSSVLRRSEDPKIRLRAAYNLGNAAFKLGDFASAAAYYKKALRIDPSSNDAAYNLELALRGLEKQKSRKKKDQGSRGKGNRKKGPQKEKGNKGKDGSSQEGQDDHKTPKGKGSRDQDQDREKDSARGKTSAGEQPAPQDLGGELRPRQALPRARDGGKPDRSRSLMDRKKAEALLDNVKEDRSKYLKFQSPGGRPRRGLSGKDW